MKILKLTQIILLVIMLMPATVSAQGFNNHYTFQTQYRSGTHTDAVQLANGLIAEAGNIIDPNSGNVVTEIGLIGTAPAPPNGMMVPPTFYYFATGPSELYAVDMVEDPSTPNSVIQVCNHYDQSVGLWRTIVFQVNPATGGIGWSVMLGNNLPYHLTGAAITSDNMGNVYVLANAVNGISLCKPYLAMITPWVPGPIIVWERMYFDPGFPDAGHEAIDLIWDQGPGNIIFTTNRSLYPPLVSNITPDGVMTFEINGGGGYITSSRLPTLQGVRDVFAKDITLAPNNDYVIVGRVNPTAATSNAFSQIYTAGLAPLIPTVYPSPSGNLFWMTGVKPYNGGYVMTSFDFYTAGGVLVPGMLELAAGGAPVNPGIVYTLPTPPGFYIQTKGLVAMNNNMDFTVKGEIMPPSNVGSLHMFSEFTPFAPPSLSLCEGALFVGQSPDTPPIIYPMADSMPVTPNPFVVLRTQINGSIYDCQANIIGAFKLAPTGVDENIEELGYRVYPNPSNGNVTLEFSAETVSLYQRGEIFNALGELIMTFNVNKEVERVDLSGQVPGIYLIRLKGSDGKVSEAKRIMIE